MAYLVIFGMSRFFDGGSRVKFCYFLTCCDMLCHVTSCHVVLSYVLLVVFCFVMEGCDLLYVKSCHVICCVTSCAVVAYHVMSTEKVSRVAFISCSSCCSRLEERHGVKIAMQCLSDQGSLESSQDTCLHRPA